MARQSSTDLVGVLRLTRTPSSLPLFTCFCAHRVRGDLTKLRRHFTDALPYRCGLAMASSAAVPPCTPTRMIRTFPKGTIGCASLRGARWCSPRGRRLPAGEARSSEVPPPLGCTDQWGRRPTVSRRGIGLGVDLGVYSFFQRGFEKEISKMIFQK